MPIEPNPITAHGKFLSRSGRKFFFKAVRLDDLSSPLDFSAKVTLRDRLERLFNAHTTGLIVAVSQVEAVLDLAAQIGLSTIVEIPIEPAALLDRAGLRAARAGLERTIRSLRGRCGLVGYLIHCPFSRDLLKAYGLERIQARLRRLIVAIRRADDQSLIAIRHSVSTLPAALLEEDCLYSVVPPLSLPELSEFAAGLHNLAEARPIIIEFERSSADQDDLVGCAFGLGAAGVVAPVMQRSQLLYPLALKSLRAGELMPFLTLNGSCPPPPERRPAVSVVICAYNAERTMRACLESLRKLDYLNCEVVIVDDGSRDRTAEIAMEFPEFRLIRQPNKGLSVARNVGMHAARGRLVAYTDSDCVVDPHWLMLMVRAIEEGGFDGCGGPNYPPPEDGRIEACVAASPGAPSPVLIGRDRAEHLAGCNMIFTKSALLAVGGFDPQFNAAGDDVDICWRLIDAGYRLGFCPSAFVWHFRRNTIAAYYRQQRGYGRAESLLYAKYPERFNFLGQIRWRGAIPGLSRTLPLGGPGRRVLWSAARPGAPTVFEPAPAAAYFVPQTLEWNLFAAAALPASIAAGFSVIPALLMLAIGPIWALCYARQAPLEKRHRGYASRLLVAWLTYSGPILRALTRRKLRLRSALRTRPFNENTTRQRPRVRLIERALALAYWNETYTTRESLLDSLRKLLARAGYAAIVDPGWNDFDLEVRTGPCTRVQIKTADEEHGGMRLRNLVVMRVRISRLIKSVLLAGVLGSVAVSLVGSASAAFIIALLTSAAGALAASEACESLRTAYRAVEQSAEELRLIPLGESTRAQRRRARVLSRRARPQPANADLFAETPSLVE